MRRLVPGTTMDAAKFAGTRLSPHNIAPILANFNVAGPRVDMVWLVDRPDYIDSMGMLPEYQRGGLGLQIAQFIVKYCQRRGRVRGAGRISVKNRSVRMLLAAFKGRQLGLSTTLTLRGQIGAVSGVMFDVVPVAAARCRTHGRA